MSFDLALAFSAWRQVCLWLPKGRDLDHGETDDFFPMKNMIFHRMVCQIRMARSFVGLSWLETPNTKLLERTMGSIFNSRWASFGFSLTSTLKIWTKRGLWTKDLRYSRRWSSYLSVSPSKDEARTLAHLFGDKLLLRFGNVRRTPECPRSRTPNVRRTPECPVRRLRQKPKDRVISPSFEACSVFPLPTFFSKTCFKLFKV